MLRRCRWLATLLVFFPVFFFSGATVLFASKRHGNVVFFVFCVGLVDLEVVGLCCMYGGRASATCSSAGLFNMMFSPMVRYSTVKQSPCLKGHYKTLNGLVRGRYPRGKAGLVGLTIFIRSRVAYLSVLGMHLL